MIISGALNKISGYIGEVKFPLMSTLMSLFLAKFLSLPSIQPVLDIYLTCT